MILPAFGQTIDCKCRQVEGQEYMCKCIANGTMPASLDFTAPVPTSGMTSAVPTATPRPAVASSAVASTPAKAATTTPTSAGTPTGQATAAGQPIYTGPRGGQYHYSASGKKVYSRKK